MTSCIPARPLPVPVTSAGAVLPFLQDTTVDPPTRNTSCTSGRKLRLVAPFFFTLSSQDDKERRGLFSSEVRTPHVAALVCLSYNMEKCFRRGGRERKRALSLYLGSDAFHPKNSHNFSIAGNAAK